jgi:hypothetical protein
VSIQACKPKTRERKKERKREGGKGTQLAKKRTNI